MLRAGQWSSGPLLLAATAPGRRRGVIPAMGPLGVLLATRSIHGWGLTEGVRWVGLDDTGTIVATGILEPRRLCVAPAGVGWMAEVPRWVPPPPLREAAKVVPILAAWPGD
jgi:hypothetical protein